MNKASSDTRPRSTGSVHPEEPDSVTEFLVLPDGRLMIHNLTPTMASLLSELNPEDELMRERAQRKTQT